MNNDVNMPSSSSGNNNNELLWDALNDPLLMLSAVDGPEAQRDMHLLEDIFSEELSPSSRQQVGAYIEC